MTDRVSQASPCKSCGKPIRWINTENDKPMPVDSVAQLFVTEKGRVVKLYQPHWGSCPGANEHRKRGD